MIRNITGYGEGNGPWISVHVGFQSLTAWADFMPGSDRVALYVLLVTALTMCLSKLHPATPIHISALALKTPPLSLLKPKSPARLGANHSTTLWPRTE